MGTTFSTELLVNTAPADEAGSHVDPNSVRSVDRAAALLIALADWDGQAGVTEIARRLGLHKSTASRLLATLLLRGLVDQDESSGKYRLGRALVHLGGQAEKAIDLRSIAMPELQRLARDAKETVMLNAVSGDSASSLAWSDAFGMARQRSGSASPLHATASGKVLLTNRPERELIRLARAGLTPYTTHTIIRADMLLEEIARVRRRGFATSFGEHEPTVNAVAAPVFDHRAQVIAAIEVRATGNRITPLRVQELFERLRDAAASITEQVGGVAAVN
ncbi:MAG TPA: IclR family transcriptional regulator [Candidatus Limnocylindrales bacterium]